MSLPNPINVTYVSPQIGDTFPFIYIVKDTDNIINIDSTHGEVHVILRNIRNSGMLQYQPLLSINDGGNNASVNNITIYPSGGDVINDSASFVLNNDGANSIIQISDINQWVVSSSQSGGGGGTPFEGLNYVYVYGNGTTALENGQQLLDGYNLASSKVVLINPTIDLGELEFTLDGMGWLSSIFSYEILQPYISNGQLNNYSSVTLNILGDGNTYGCNLIPTMGGYYLQSYFGTLPPNGISSITNFYTEALKSTLIVGSGYYEIDGQFQLTQNYLDVVSLTGNMDVNIKNISGSIAIRVASEYIFVKGLNTNEQSFRIFDPYYNNKYEKCQGGDYSFGANGVDSAGEFIDCKGGQYSFGSLGGNAVGSFINCISGANSFGGSDNIALVSNAYGTFKNCIADGGSFGMEQAGGTFTDCISYGDISFGGGQGSVQGVANGVFVNCQSYSNSFGGNNGTASGTFTNCIGLNSSFGRIATGQFRYCRAQNDSFGFSDSLQSLASGTFIGCESGNWSFGSNRNNGYPTSSGTFRDCKAGQYSFGSSNNSESGGTSSGIFTNCIAGENSFGFRYVYSEGIYINCVAQASSCFGGGTEGFSIASGNYINCSANFYSFGGNGQATGNFSNCRGLNYCFGNSLSSGNFENCQSGQYSFGANGSSSGTFTNCSAIDSIFNNNSYSFGSGGTASGVFINCIGATGCFGAYGTTSGTFTYCIGDAVSFGINITGVLMYCRLTSGSFATVSSGGKTRLCLDGTYTLNNQG
jgi:hypothetical protein